MKLFKRSAMSLLAVSLMLSAFLSSCSQDKKKVNNEEKTAIGEQAIELAENTEAENLNESKDAENKTASPASDELQIISEEQQAAEDQKVYYEVILADQKERYVSNELSDKNLKSQLPLIFSAFDANKISDEPVLESENVYTLIVDGRSLHIEEAQNSNGYLLTAEEFVDGEMHEEYALIEGKSEDAANIAAFIKGLSDYYLDAPEIEPEFPAKVSDLQFFANEYSIENSALTVNLDSAVKKYDFNDPEMIAELIGLFPKLAAYRLESYEDIVCFAQFELNSGEFTCSIAQKPEGNLYMEIPYENKFWAYELPAESAEAESLFNILAAAQDKRID